MICDSQRVTVFFVAQQELTFVVGAPQLVGLLPQRQGRALSMIVSAPSALDQAVAIEHGVGWCCAPEPSPHRKSDAASVRGSCARRSRVFPV